ncbi:zinc-binding dehydrogenase [Xanthobacter sp. KR7-225]|uniref:zinc-binding dehydrogenase n=1 Tax=Xanthobacter sp. KR7-225 TaxID=3156613 RepID=UPI0032B54356
MLAAYASHFDPDRPLAGLKVGPRPLPAPPAGWARVKVVAAALNHHDLWSLKGGEAMRQRGGAGLSPADLPRILGMDAAGVSEDGAQVIVHPLISAPAFGVLSGRYDGTFADYVCVPRENLVAKPAALGWEEAACLPTAWLTAWRMLFEKARVEPGGSILVQGASGGLSTALVMLAKAAGLRVFVTGRSAASRAFARARGADEAVEPGARLPERVDAAMDSVGPATWDHSLKCLKRGGVMVVPGGTTGYSATVDIARLFTMDLTIVGSAMGSRAQLEALAGFCAARGLRPPVARVLPLGEAAAAFAALERGAVGGKIVLRP